MVLCLLMLRTGFQLGLASLPLSCKPLLTHPWGLRRIRVFIEANTPLRCVGIQADLALGLLSAREGTSES